jgi:SNW domain-containing protein 1
MSGIDGATSNESLLNPSSFNGKRSKYNRDDDRDVSEKVALGMLAGQGVRRDGGSSEALYDARLFNQSEGVSGGFGNDDDYNVYGQAWRSSGGASVGESIYRPRTSGGANGGGGVLSSSDADKALTSLRAGASNRFTSNTSSGAPTGPRPSGPVEFERGKTDIGSSSDPFGLDSLLASTTSNSTRRPNALDGLGKGRVGGGFMSTVAGGSSLMPGESSGRTSLEFAKSK